MNELDVHGTKAGCLAVSMPDGTKPLQIRIVPKTYGHRMTFTDIVEVRWGPKPEDGKRMTYEAFWNAVVSVLTTR